MTYTDTFLTSLGRWQRGWKRDPVLRGTIATDLVREAALLPDFVRQHDGSPLFRKRNLYRREDQGELVPLFLQGELDEGSPTSWSKSLAFAEKFGSIFDDTDPNSVAGSIFQHIPAPNEVIVNVNNLWEDQTFVAAADDYRKRGGPEARALFHYRDERDQHEVILRAPLKVDEICRLGRPTTTENIYAAAKALSDADKDKIDRALAAQSINPFEARYLPEDVSRRVALNTQALQQARMALWMYRRMPDRRTSRKGRRRGAIELGDSEKATDATFLGWRTLRGPDGILEARWSDGTVVYSTRGSRVWLW